MSPVAAGSCLQHRNGRAAASGFTKRHPESGYITPDQQELIDSIFSTCLQQQQQQQQSNNLSRCSASDSPAATDGIYSSSSAAYPRPPVEFSDVGSRSYGPVDPSEGRLDNVIDAVGPGRSSRSSSVVGVDCGTRAAATLVASAAAVERHLSKSATMAADCAAGGRRNMTVNDVVDSSSLAPYLACVIPPPPSPSAMESGGTQSIMESSVVIVDPSSLIVPPPPPVDLTPADARGNSEAHFRQSLSSSSSAAANSPDSPTSAAKLPPPPTLPKQSRRTSLPQDPSSPVGAETASTGHGPMLNSKTVRPTVAMPDITRGLPAGPGRVVGRQQLPVNNQYGNGKDVDDGMDFFPPPPPLLCESSGIGSNDLIVSSLPPPPPLLVDDPKAMRNASDSPRRAAVVSSSSSAATFDLAQALNGVSVGRMCRGMPSQKWPAVDDVADKTGKKKITALI